MILFGGGTKTNSDGTINVQSTITDSNIVLPVQIKNSDRVYQLSTATVLAANGVYIGLAIDCGNVKRVCGHVMASHVGTLYVQQSDDGSTNWLTISTTAISATTSTTISGTAYNSGTQFDINITSKWARIIYVNGATAQTAFILSGYTTPQ